MNNGARHRWGKIRQSCTCRDFESHILILTSDGTLRSHCRSWLRRKLDVGQAADRVTSYGVGTTLQRSAGKTVNMDA